MQSTMDISTNATVVIYLTLAPELKSPNFSFLENFSNFFLLSVSQIHSFPITRTTNPTKSLVHLAPNFLLTDLLVLSLLHP